MNAMRAVIVVKSRPKTNSERGSLHLAAILAVAVLAVIAFAGYHVYRAQHTDPEKFGDSSNSQAITSADDVQKASDELDKDTPNGLDPAQLDDDLNGLL